MEGTGGFSPSVGQNLLNELDMASLSISGPPQPLQFGAGTLPTSPSHNQDPEPGLKRHSSPDVQMDGSDADNKRLRLDRESKRERQRNARRAKTARKAALKSEQREVNEKKEHDNGVWQVPDVAFKKNENAVTITMSADAWAQLKADALASRSKAGKQVKQDSIDKSNSMASASQKANSEATTISKTSKSEELQATTVKPRKSRSERRQTAKQSKVLSEPEVGNTYWLRPRPLKSSVNRESVSGDTYWPSECENRRPVSENLRQPHELVGKDSYRPSCQGEIGNAEVELHQQHYHYEDARSQPSTSHLPRGGDEGDYYSSRPQRSQNNETLMQDNRVVQQTQAHDNQQQGLGYGLWYRYATLNSQPTGNASTAHDTPYSYDINAALREMHLSNHQAEAATSRGQWQRGMNFSNVGPTPLLANTGIDPTARIWNPSNVGPYALAHSMHTTSQNTAAEARPSNVSKSQPVEPPKPTHLPRDKLVEPERPTVSARYQEQASKSPRLMTTPQPLLIICDMNGTLIWRKNGVTFKKRPGLSEFMSFIMDMDKDNNTEINPPVDDAEAKNPNNAEPKNLLFMIWTSARRRTTKDRLNHLFDVQVQARFAGVWCRETLNLSPAQYMEKVQVYKRLELVWRNKGIQRTHPHHSAGERWGQHNTILIDDSALKACSEPHNLINVPELTSTQWQLEATRAVGHAKGAEQPGVLRQVAEYIDEARWYADVSAFMREKPFVASVKIARAPKPPPQWGPEDEVNADTDSSDEDYVDVESSGVPLGQPEASAQNQQEKETTFLGLQELYR